MMINTSGSSLPGSQRYLSDSLQLLNLTTPCWRPLSKPYTMRPDMQLEVSLLDGISLLISAVSDQTDFACSLDRSRSPISLVLATKGGSPSPQDRTDAQKVLDAVAEARDKKHLMELVLGHCHRGIAKCRRKLFQTDLTSLLNYLLHDYYPALPDNEELELDNLFVQRTNYTVFDSSPTVNQVLAEIMLYLRLICMEEDQNAPHAESTYFEWCISLASMLLDSPFLQQAKQIPDVRYVATKYARRLEKLKQYHSSVSLVHSARRIWLPPDIQRSGIPYRFISLNAETMERPIPLSLSPLSVARRFTSSIATLDKLLVVHPHMRAEWTTRELPRLHPELVLVLATHRDAFPLLDPETNEPITTPSRLFALQNGSSHASALFASRIRQYGAIGTSRRICACCHSWIVGYNHSTDLRLLDAGLDVPPLEMKEKTEWFFNLPSGRSWRDWKRTGVEALDNEVTERVDAMLRREVASLDEQLALL